MPADPVTDNELKEAFFSLKTNKSPGFFLKNKQKPRL